MELVSLMFHFSYEEASMFLDKWKIKEVERRNNFGGERLLSVVFIANSWSPVTI